MADVIEYTPEQLRALADEMDGAERKSGHIRHVTVSGIGVDVDMRVIGDIRTMRQVGKIQKGGDDGVFAAIDLFDRILGDQRGEVEERLADADGFVPVDDYVSFCMAVFEAVGAKN